MFVASTPHGDDVTGVYGAYADRLQYAVYSSAKLVNALVEHVAASPSMGYTESGPLQGQHEAFDELPLRLRTGTR
jgi:hypothetical protein